MSNLTIETQEGRVEGLLSTDGQCRIFRGVPYAQPPVGELRFRRPQPKKPWKGVRAAKAFSPKAFQGDVSRDPFYGKEFYAGMDTPCSEDCLYLNIWTPSQVPPEGLPVLMWIHGGAFLHGCGSEIEFDGEGLCQKGVILVTINYRVGALGFFTSPELEQENPEGISGNYGILDQIAALKWIHHNIGAFGGDKNRISIAGQSAGCMSVQCLISSDLTRGLITGAILQSGGGLPGISGSYAPEDQMKASRLLLEELGVSTVEELRSLSPEAVCNAGYSVLEQVGGLCWRPNVDGYVLKEHPTELAKQGKIHDIPYMIGSTKNDIGAQDNHQLLRSAVNWAKNQERLSRQPAYLYYFTRSLPGDLSGAFHSCELWYEFETMDRCWRPFTEEDFALSTVLSSHFANFVKCGNPNATNLPLWEPYTQSNPVQMVYCEDSTQKLV